MAGVGNEGDGEQSGLTRRAVISFLMSRRQALHRAYSGRVLTASRPLYFWHVPKTAGTSFIQWLDGQFGPADVFAPQLLPQLRASTEEEVQGRRLYRGHLGSELPARVQDRVDSITLVREPRARTLSHLTHIWRDPTHYLHARLRNRGADLRTALEDSVLRTAVTDVQSRFFALRPERTTTTLPLPVPEDLREQASYELAPLPRPALLAGRALLRLSRMAAVGRAEELDAFAVRIAAARGWPRPTGLPRSNVSAPDSSPWRLADLGPDELTLLDAVNRADRAVYRIVAKLTPTPAPGHAR